MTLESRLKQTLVKAFLGLSLAACSTSDPEMLPSVEDTGVTQNMQTHPDAGFSQDAGTQEINPAIIWSRGTPTDIYLADPDGQNSRLIISNAQSARFSPDGTKIAAMIRHTDSQNITTYGLQTFDRNGNPLGNELAIVGRNAPAAVWSNDGQKLVYSGHIPCRRDIRSIQLTPTGELDLASDQAIFSELGDYPSMAAQPGTNNLLVQVNQCGAGSSLETFVQTGNTLTRLNPLLTSNNPKELYEKPSFSSGGNQISYGHSADGTRTTQAYLANSDGTNQTQLPIGNIQDRVVFGPTNTVYFIPAGATDEATDIVRLDLNTNQVTKITNDPLTDQHYDGDIDYTPGSR